MKLEIVGRNLQIDDSLRAFVDQKAKKLARLLDAASEIRVTLALEKFSHVAELHAIDRGDILQAREETAGSFQDAVTGLIEKAAQQARRAHERQRSKKRRTLRAQERWPVEVLDGRSIGGGGRPTVIETIDLEIKPMAVEEAVLALEDSDYGFVVFHDSGRNRLSVLYRRKDKNYGLISPEL
jgi:putative sigma-54 modulation protein